MRPKPEHPAVEKIVLLMVSGLSGEDLEAACTKRLGVPAAKIPAVIAAAKRRLTLAADYNRDEQIGAAMTRLNDLYARSLKGADFKTALATQKEINKLTDLYRVSASRADSPPGPGTDAAPAAESDELAAIRGHLLPLALAAADYPLREHARIAAEIVRTHLGGRKWQ